MLWLNQAYAQLMPTPATDIAAEVDSLYKFLLISSAISCFILIGGMIYFALKYKRKTDNDQTAYITHNTFLEFLWSFIPLVIFLAVFGWGWMVYHQMRQMPQNALEIHVTGKQWAWEMTYKSGVQTANLLVVPINTDVKLIMTSNDVIHSFFIPSFRIKQDVIPGVYSSLWFRANKFGEFHVFCTEYCGTQHSGMLAKLKVVTQKEYEQWLEDEANVKNLPLAQRGEKLFQVKACAGCHSVKDAKTIVGPALWQRFGQKEEADDGQSYLVDENHVRESILNPNAKITKGFQKNVMPAFAGQLSEIELSALIEYIKGLK